MPITTSGLTTRFKQGAKYLTQLMSKPKKAARAVLLMTGLMALVACGGEKTNANVTRIGVAIPNFDDTFFVSMKNSMSAYAEQQGDLELIFVDAKEDTVKQLGQVQNFIIQQVDGIVVIPVNTDATQPITDKVIKSGIELVYLNRRPKYLPSGVAYVGSEELQFGEEQAKYVAAHTDGGNIGIIMGMMTIEAAILRTQSVEEYFNDKPEYNIIRKQTALWQRSQGMIVMENWINSGDKLDIIISNNDDMALGAIQALRAAGKLDDTIVVGVDATPDGLMAIKDGVLDATVFQNGRSQAHGAIDAVLSGINGTPREEITWIPAELVTKDNLAEFEIKQG